MKKNLPIAIIATSVLGLGSLSSCQDYTPYDSEVLVKTSFEDNFKKTFGEISPSQTWDLTTVIPRTWKYDVELSDAITRTHAGDQYHEANASSILRAKQPDVINSFTTEPDWAKAGWYEVKESTLDWMHEHLVEGRVNTNQGAPFTLHAPDNAFAIIPIYQGQAGLSWDLHLVDMTNNNDYKLWSKSEGIWRYQNDAWSKPDITNAGGHTINAERVLSRPIIIDAGKVNGDFFLYLDITVGTSGNQYALVGTAQCSNKGMMLSLQCPIPDGLNEFTGHDNSFCMIIGAEDADLTGSDWDMNDVVFLLVGYPNIPEVIEHYHKRYLCEDLGNTYDFDFNDIVVDVQQNSYYNAIINASGQAERVEDVGKRTQTATIEHICGSLPFQVTVGDYTFPAVSDPTDKNKTLDELGTVGTTRGTIEPLKGYNPEVSMPITGWDRNTNNISIAVADRVGSSVLTGAFGAENVIEEDAEKHIYRIDFPGTGDVPLIIAVDRMIPWMAEHEHIPVDWWKDGKFYDSSQTESSWITVYPLEHDGVIAILQHHVEHLRAGVVNEIEDFYNQTPGHAHLVQALDEGYKTLVIHFAEAVSGSYSLKTGENVLFRETTTFESTNELTITLSDVEINFIRQENGLKIPISVSSNVNVTSITATLPSGD
ncbi:MAG: hypothetical protein J6S89_00630 [Paludibacteraceae bacterium]|nr:hypothetical protein [Paludibacteraceae bacterium]